MYTIVYFLDYGEQYGGAVHALLQQSRLVEQAGNTVHVFLSNYHGNQFDKEFMNKLVFNGYEITTAGFQLSSQPEDIDVVCLNDNYEDVLDTVRKCNPDLLHSVQLNPMAELISRELGVPHIMNIYPLSSDFFKLKYLDIFPHYHICDSEYWAKQWQYYLDTDYTCIRTVVNGMQEKHRTGFGRKLVCVCVGTIYSGKNQLGVIEGFYNAYKQGFCGELFLYGYAEGAYADACEKFIKDNKLDEIIHMMGFEYDMDSVYRRSDILISGSFRESYPNVISEAMAHGVLVLSTAVGGIPEVICDGENGYLTQGTDSNCIASGLLKVQEDVLVRHAENVRSKAYETVYQLHAPKAVQSQIISYYQYVLNDYEEWGKKDRPLAKDIISPFYSMIEFYQNNILSFTNTRNISLKLWYLYYIKPFIENAVNLDKEFYIWGTGKMSKAVMELVQVFFKKITLKGMVDSNRVGKYEQYEIYSPDKILKKDNIVVFIALLDGQWDVVHTLEQYNKKYLYDYFILSPRAW